MRLRRLFRRDRRKAWWRANGGPSYIEFECDAGGGLHMTALVRCDCRLSEDGATWLYKGGNGDLEVRITGQMGAFVIS